MHRVVIAVVLAGVVAGCGSQGGGAASKGADFDSSRLAKGTRVMLASEDGLIGFGPTGDTIEDAIHGSRVTSGTKAIVESDGDPDDSKYRKVRVVLLDGESVGRKGFVSRGDIVPE